MKNASKAMMPRFQKCRFLSHEGISCGLIILGCFDCANLNKLCELAKLYLVFPDYFLPLHAKIF
jgi:hypothetical protein